MNAPVLKTPALLLLLCLGPACLGLAGCGQKGPLYLPQEQPEQGAGDKAPAPAAEPATPDAP